MSLRNTKQHQVISRCARDRRRCYESRRDASHVPKQRLRGGRRAQRQKSTQTDRRAIRYSLLALRLNVLANLARLQYAWDGWALGRESYL